MVNNKKSRSSVSNSRPSVSSRPSKCQKITNIKKDVGEVKEDRISSLADALLSHILSFLGTKEAVKTSALSKRWRYVWTETPVLDFSFATDLNLANFVHKILDMNKVLHLKKYRFFYLLRFDLTHVNAWIANLSERCIDDVELYLGYYIRHDLQVPFELLLGFLNRVQPVILTLAAGPLNEHLTLKDQFRLKILHLTHNSLCVAAVKRLLASCPVLEELRISQCVWDDCLHIVSSTLKYFSIDYSFDNIPAHVVNAPNLQQLYIRFIGENKFGTYFLGSCLMKAKISVLGAPLALIQAITGTKTLHLWSYWIDEPVQRAINNNELCFNYLTHLKLHLFYSMVCLLPGMLRCSPNLVSLIISKSKSCVRERDDMARLKVPKCVVSFPPLEVPKCVVLCLENVEIELSSDEDSECEDCIGMVGYFIRNAAVMKELKLSAYAEDSKKELRFLKELLMIPRASTFCQVRFINKHQQL